MKRAKIHDPAKKNERAKLGQQIDRLLAFDTAIKEAEEETKELRRRRTKLESRVFKDFKKVDIKGTTTTRAIAEIKSRKHPSIKDRAKFQRYVKRNQAFDLYQNRLNSKAYFDRLEEGEQVPGISIFESFKIHVKARRRK